MKWKGNKEQKEGSRQVVETWVWVHSLVGSWQREDDEKGRRKRKRKKKNCKTVVILMLSSE